MKLIYIQEARWLEDFRLALCTVYVKSTLIKFPSEVRFVNTQRKNKLYENKGIDTGSIKILNL